MAATVRRDVCLKELKLQQSSELFPLEIYAKAAPAPCARSNATQAVRLRRRASRPHPTPQLPPLSESYRRIDNHSYML